MPLLDVIQDGLNRVLPSKKSSLPTMSGGIGSGGHGMVPFQDDMIVSKPVIIFHTSQIFFNFLAMCCFASVAGFQAKWKVGPSGLSGFTLFITIAGMFLSAFMLLIPVIHEKYDKFLQLARLMKEVRVGFILTGTGTTVSLLIAFIVTISAWTEPGCKNPDNDPNKDKGDGFKNGLPGWCSTKKAGAIFLWLAFVFWAASLAWLIKEWRGGNLKPTGSSRLGPRDPPFTHPPTIHEADEDDVGDEESTYHDHQQIPPPRLPGVSISDSSNTSSNPFSDSNRYSPTVPSGYSSPPRSNVGGDIAPSRPSMDAYGAFSDPAPTGFASQTAPREEPRISRTMQYADPYAAVRASITPPAPTSPSGGPPSYESYSAYR